MPRPAVIQLTSPGRIACSDAEAVAMDDLALEQVGHRREADVRVRPHVHARARRQLDRPHVVEEDERPDQPLLARGSARRTEKPPRSRARASITRAAGRARR